MRPLLVSGADGLAQLLPRRWRLPFRLAVRRTAGALEKEITQLDRLVGSRRTAVDVGANEGWYSLPLARRFERVVAIEPNAELVRDLRAAAPPHLEVRSIALSNRVGNATLFIPERGGVFLTGWASLDENNLQERDGIRAVPVALETLDNLGLEQVDFLKIDVEGHEIEVLEGGEQTLRRWGSRVLIEIRDGHLPAVDRLLASWGLRRQEVEERRFLSPGNHFYAPDDLARR